MCRRMTIDELFDQQVDFYISQTEADNHAVREAACACIAELGLKVSKLFCSLTLTALKYFCIDHGEQVFFNLKSSWLSLLALSFSFKYPCYGSLTVRNILILSVLYNYNVLEGSLQFYYY